MKIYEEHLKGYKTPEGNIVDVYVNPTPYEIEDVAKSFTSAYANEKGAVRFTADNKTKKIYVFSVSVIHSYITNRLGITEPVDKIYGEGIEILNGVAKKKNGQWEMTSSDVLSSIAYGNSVGDLGEQEQRYMKMLLSTDWSWVNKYINVDKNLEFYKRKLAAKEHAEEVYRTSTQRNEEALGRIKNKLFETFHKKVIVSKNTQVEVFVNPTKMEMEKALLESHSNSLRFTAFGKDQTMYVFPMRITHFQAFEAGADWNPNKPAVSGIIVKRSGSWYFASSDQLEHLMGMQYDPRFVATVKSILNTNWQWMEKYFLLGQPFDKLMSELDSYYTGDDPKTVKKFLKKKQLTKNKL